MTVEELIDLAKKRRSEKRHQEALSLANAAVEKAPNKADAWWQVALAKYALDDLAGASTALQKTVEFAPSFAYGWALYGRALWRLGQDAKALEVLEHALAVDADEDDALETLADLYGKKGDEDKQFKVLNHLALTKGVPARFFNRLGILHYNRKNYLDAIDYYKRHAVYDKDPAPLFNLGLVYNSQEVSQEADAVDIWRLTAKRFPEFDRSQVELKRVLPRVLERTRPIAERSSLLAPGQWYSSYLNPYELLNVSREMAFDELTPKVLQKLKRTLLQEIELEDGRVSWMEDSQIDKSRAIKICDEAYDERLSEYHWSVFQSPPLLRFLTRGEHNHFVVDQDQSPLEFVERFEDEADGFLQWLSGPFTHQYNMLLVEAVGRYDLSVLECILDGRRWVTAADRDNCFEGARRRVDVFLQPLRDYAKACSAEVPTLGKLTAIVNGEQSLTSLLNLLPIYFRDYQNEACALLRSIAIACYNTYDDPELSKKVLGLADQLRVKSADLTQKLKDDQKQIDVYIADALKHEAKLVNGNVRWEITKAGARIGEATISPEAATAVRWGVLVSGERHRPIHDYLLVIRSRHDPALEFKWTASSDIEKNDVHFSNLVGATLTYLFPSIIKRIRQDLDAGHTMHIGACPLDKDGVKITTKGWFSNKVHAVPWARLGVTIENGNIVASDTRDRNVRVEMPLRGTDNAAVLQFMAVKT